MIEIFLKNKKSLLIMLLGVILFEVFICNFSYFSSMFNDEIDISEYFAKDGLISEGNNRLKVLDTGDRSIEIRDINDNIDNIYMDFKRADESEQSKYEPIEYSIYISDEGNEIYYELPRRMLISAIEKSKYVKIHNAGMCKKIKIRFHWMENKEIIVDDIVLNKKIPFYFNFYRFMAMLFICVIIYILRPKKGFYNYLFNEKSIRQSIAVIFLIIMHIPVIFTFVKANPHYVRSPFPWHNQFNEMADSLLEGKFYLKEEPGETLKSMENPYDSGYRGQVLGEHGESYKWDCAYYDGKYYSYFGIVPIIMYYIPYKLIAEEDLLNSTAVLISCILFVPSVFLFMREVIKRWFKDTPFILYVILSEALILGSGFLLAVKKPDMYHLPVITGLMFSFYGLYFWIKALNTKDNKIVIKNISLFLGSLFMAFVAGSRPQMMAAYFLALPLFYESVFKERTMFSRKSIIKTTLFILPFVAFGAFLMYYNYSRFDSIFDFGANYNLTTNDMTKRGFVLARIPLGLYSYLFQPLIINGQFPFLNTAELTTNYMGKTINETVIGGVFLSQPLIIMSLFILKAKNTLKEKGLFYFALISFIGAFLIVIADTQMAGIVSRYYIDFVWLFYITAILVILCAYEYFKNNEYIKYFYIVIASLFLFGLFCDAATLFLRFDTDISVKNPKLFYNVFYTVQFWF